MNNQELRDLKESLGIINYKINYKTGVHLGVIENFFDRASDDIDSKDRAILEALLAEEAKKH
ncbi:MAG: hypothetical protein Q4A32_07910 [Lachnospiraceae bacterium]|nr:hypothetical protein [Lachnospiraceae bacterium]